MSDEINQDLSSKVTTCLADPDRRLKVIIALRDRTMNMDVLGGKEQFTQHKLEKIDLWLGLAHAIYGEANAIRRQLGMPERCYDTSPLHPGPLPEMSWSRLQLYRQLYEFWYPDVTLPFHDTVVNLSHRMAKMVTDRIPANTPYSQFFYQEVLEQFARDFFGIKLDLFNGQHIAIGRNGDGILTDRIDDARCIADEIRNNFRHSQPVQPLNQNSGSMNQDRRDS